MPGFHGGGGGGRQKKKRRKGKRDRAEKRKRERERWGNVYYWGILIIHINSIPPKTRRSNVKLILKNVQCYFT